jgi:hypothetical protein
MGNQSSVQVVCAEYEGLFNKSQVALTSWAYERAEISRHRGRDVNDKLRTLQRDFLKAWELLQNHKRDCEVCQVISTIEHVHAGTRAAALRTPFLEFTDPSFSPRQEIRPVEQDPSKEPQEYPRGQPPNRRS